MKKLYFLLLALGLFINVDAQNSYDRDPNFNQFNLPVNNYFVDANVTKSQIMPDGKILLIKDKKSLIRLNSNLLDTSFNTGSGFVSNNTYGLDLKVNDFVVQPDGKILVAGNFTSYNGHNKAGLIRLNQDGSIDLSFNFTTSGYVDIISVNLQVDGKIIQGIDGQFKRLNQDGSIDNSFNLPLNYTYGTLTALSDGKFLIAHAPQGSFNVSPNKISKFNSDGTFDTSFFMASFGDLDGVYVAQIFKITIQNNGKILVAGRFSSCNSVLKRNLVRLNGDGSIDTLFAIGDGFKENTNTYGSNFTTETIEQLDHKIIVVGKFDSYNNVIRKNIVRLNSDGSIDNTFLNVQSFLGIDIIYSASFFNDEKILVSGTVGDRKSDSYIVKINTDGTKDLNFNNRDKGFFYSHLFAVAETNDNKILVGGMFHMYNDTKSFSFIRLNSDGSIDNTLTFNGFQDGIVTAITPLSNGVIYLGGTFTKYDNRNSGNIIRLYSDGTKDATFNLSAKSFDGFSSKIKKIVVLDNGNILVGGSFTSFGVNLTSGLVLLTNLGNYSYDLPVGNDIRFIEKQTDGKILVGGNLGSNAGIRRYSNLMELDGTFVLDPLITRSIVDSAVLQQDGKILMEGSFTINGVSSRLIRIFNNGNLDTSFISPIENGNLYISDVEILPNQKFLISYKDYSVTPEVRRIKRLNNNGSVDNTFIEQNPEDNDPLASETYIHVLSNGKILLFGNILKYQGQFARGMVCLLGEDYNFIQGQNNFDFNNNGCDVNDEVFKNLKMHVSSGSNSFDYIANSTGNFKLAFTNGTHTITPVFENPSYFTVAPTNVVVNFPTQASPFTQNFCITANGVHPDLEVSILPINTARPGFDATYKLIYKNKGNTTQSGTVAVNFNDAVLDLITSTPAATATLNNLSWNFVNLAPLETREIAFTLNVNSPMEIPAVNTGDILNFTATITSPATDDMPSDNTFIFNQTVVNSFDPNDKTCLEGASILPSKVGDYVHYLIRFENNGTANAQNIIVKDMIDLAKFDINTLVPIKGSHSFVTNITAGNKVEFIFENINLPFDDANNDGYVVFKIKTLPTLFNGDTFSNSASIYFDYNFPIVTNTTTTTIGALARQDFEFSNYWNCYPNPAQDILHIASKVNMKVNSISIYNTLGQLVIVIPNANEVNEIDVSSLRSGNYYLKINSDKGISNMKFIKM